MPATRWVNRTYGTGETQSEFDVDNVTAITAASGGCGYGECGLLVGAMQLVNFDVSDSLDHVAGVPQAIDGLPSLLRYSQNDRGIVNNLYLGQIEDNLQAEGGVKFRAS